MKKILFLLLLFLGFFFSSAKADSGGKYDSCSFVYVGGNLGLAGQEVGHSKFPLKIGGQFRYYTGYNIIKLAYNKLSVFQFDNEPDTKERFSSMELSYGRLLRIGDFRFLFKNLYIGASAGLSINFIDYYNNSGNAWDHRITSDRRYGIPLSIFTENNFGSLFTGGFEYKYSILQHAFPASEINFSINVKLF